jgi:hypothetical protein
VYSVLKNSTEHCSLRRIDDGVKNRERNNPVLRIIFLSRDLTNSNVKGQQREILDESVINQSAQQ